MSIIITLHLFFIPLNSIWFYFCICSTKIRALFYWGKFCWKANCFLFLMSETIGKPILPVFYDVKLVYSYFFLYILSSGKCKYQFQHCCGWPLIKISLEMLKGYKETLLWKWEELVQSYSCRVILKCKGKPWSSSKSVKIACWHVLAVPLMTSSAHFLNTYSDLSSADSNTDGPYFHAVNPWLYTPFCGPYFDTISLMK